MLQVIISCFVNSMVLQKTARVLSGTLQSCMPFEVIVAPLHVSFSLCSASNSEDHTFSPFSDSNTW